MPNASEACACTQYTKFTKSLHSTCITKIDNFPFHLNWPVQFSHVWLCNPMDCSMPGFPVHHYLLELTKTHLHWQWCHATISSPVVPFSYCLQSFPASGSFLVSQFFASGGQSIGVSALSSALPMNIQDLSPLGWTSWISLQSRGPPRVSSSTTVQKHQFFSTQLSLWSNSHIHTWLLEKP